ncbi:hypothetical protein IAQ61_005188 [Plenodomus lingam]|uniref:uncharacterized protein n=1 Tax=Leptosphaeria maculans TaxID=5022 RepID=UPI00331A5B9A|nr:hypothetical protein IAQ61_005188 [Plenodomus lingam]
MWLVIQLHYAYRLLLLHIDRLIVLALVEAEDRSVRCYVGHTHTVSASSQQTPDNHCTQPGPTSLYNPKVLLEPMKPSTVASCTIANEFLRRRMQLDRDPTTRRHRNSSQRACPTSFTVDDTLPRDLDPIKPAQIHQKVKRVRSRRVLDIEEGHSPERQLKDAAHSARTATEQHRRPNMWRLGLDPDRRNSPLFAVMRKDPERALQDKQIAQLSSPQRLDDWEGDELSDTQGGAQEWMARTDHECAQETTPDHCCSCLPAMEDDGDSNEDHARSRKPNRADIGVGQAPTFGKSASPTSDTTLCESNASPPRSQVKTSCSPWDHAHPNGATYDQVVFAEAAQFEREENHTPTPVRRRWARHQRKLSTESLIPARTPTPLRARARTNDGLLQLKANTTHDSNIQTGARQRHRRKISLKIPINTPIRRAETVEHPNQSTWNGSPHRAVVTAHKISRPLTHEERELEYKHRHTFIGVTSLDDFLEALEVSSTHTTTKEAVAKGFISLAHNEQMLARSSSTRTEGWELVPRVTPDTSSIDYVAQLQVKLGSITLRHFLDMIPFDSKDEVSALHVVEAFSAASHLDAQAGVGTGRKAKAFRTWMVTQAHHVV